MATIYKHREKSTLTDLQLAKGKVAMKVLGPVLQSKRALRLISFIVYFTPILLQSFSNTADTIQILTSGWGIIGIVVIIFANVLIIIFIRSTDSKSQPNENIGGNNRTKQRRQEKKERGYVLWLRVVFFLQLAIILILIIRDNNPLNYNRVMSEYSEESEAKQNTAVENIYEPQPPPPGSILGYWQPFREQNVDPGEIPSGISMLMGTAEVVREVSDQNNLALMVSGGESGASINFAEMLPKIQRHVGFIINPVLRFRIKQISAENSWDPLLEDGQWHVVEVRYEATSSTDGNFFIYQTTTIDGQLTSRVNLNPDGRQSAEFTGYGRALRLAPHSVVLIDDIIGWDQLANG